MMLYPSAGVAPSASPATNSSGTTVGPLCTAHLPVRVACNVQRATEAVVLAHAGLMPLVLDAVDQQELTEPVRDRSKLLFERRTHCFLEHYERRFLSLREAALRQYRSNGSPKLDHSVVHFGLGEKRRPGHGVHGLPFAVGVSQPFDVWGPLFRLTPSAVRPSDQLAAGAPWTIRARHRTTC
jgi:hypothetical protein